MNAYHAYNRIIEFNFQASMDHAIVKFHILIMEALPVKNASIIAMNVH